MAVNCSVKLAATEGAAGVMAIDTSGLVTFMMAVPEMLPWVAMIVTVAFGVTAVARPAAVMVAPVEALHVTALVMFWVLPSVNVPVAVYCCVLLGAMGLTEAGLGVTAIDTSGLVTVNVVVPVTDPEEAEIVVVPIVSAVARPEVVMDATEVLDDSQFAEAVRSLELPSL